MSPDVGSTSSLRSRSRRRLDHIALALLCCTLVLVLVLGGPGAAAQTTNLALNRPVAVSSSENAGAFPPAAAVDGNTGTRWSSAFSDPQWIRVDLGTAQNIGRVVLRWEASYGKAYQIQVSNDASAWTTISNVTNGDGGVDDLTVSGNGRYVRMYGTQRTTIGAAQYGYSLWEFEVYGTGGTTPTNTSIATPTRTPTRTPTPPPTSGCTTVSNIALNKPAYAYFYEILGEEPGKAVDGNMSTRWGHLWYPAGPASGWLDVDLGANAATITQVKIFWEAALAADYQVQVSNNRTSWTTVRTVTNNTALTNDLLFSPAVTGRYLRINMTRKGTAYGYSIWELQVNGCNGAPASYPPAPSPLTGAFSRVWFDNFDGTALNASNWAYDNNVHVNGEVQQYTTNNVAVSGGTLKITARRETVNGYPFTSGRIFTKGLRSFTYGKIVARMRMPVGDGYWPAFWMMGENIDTVGWPGNGELDIMENIGYSNWVSGALHGPGYWGAGSVGGRHDLPAGQSISGWHTYAVEWDPTYIKWLIDDVVVRTVTRQFVIDNHGQWTFDNPKFIILNLALGGDYPHGYNQVTTPYYGLPQSTVDNIVAGGGVVEVDYVEVWKKP